MSELKDKSFTELISFMGSFLIFLGITRLMSYYGEFGISIVNYLEFTEILTSFFDVLVFAIFALAVTFIQAFFLSSKTTEKEIQNRTKMLEEPSLLKRVGLFFSFYFSKIIGNIVGWTFNALLLKYFDTSFSWSSLLYWYLIIPGMYFFLFFLNEIEIRHKEFQSSETFKYYLKLLIYSLLIFVYITYIGYRQAKSTKETKTYYGTVIELENNIKLVSDSTSYFIGNTKNFIYIYHEKSKTVDVIPMSRVKALTIQRTNK